MATILVVDDDAYMRLFLYEALTAAGHEVFPANDGRAAVCRYRELHPDLVITDILMPERDGFDVIFTLVPYHAKIIAISGGGDGRDGFDLEDAITFGALDVLRKPFSIGLLYRTVDQVLVS